MSEELFSESSRSVFVRDLNCTGDEAGILDCGSTMGQDLTCDGGSDAAVVCYGR